MDQSELVGKEELVGGSDPKAAARLHSRSLLRPVAKSLGAALSVLLLAWIDFRVLHVNSATAAFTFLLLVLGIATRVGLRESIIASVGSMFAYNFFFLPPIGTFTISDPQNWVALFAFLATAVTVSQLSSSARRKAEEAQSREQELRRMYNFSRALMLGDVDRSLADHITRQLAEAFGFDSVAFYDAATGKTCQIAREAAPLPDSLLR
ncbi:MAG: DUF4118 domain-containing protein, partial [Acidobacteriota bacterium]|nr:DUF4118 domain-containing protein [Acidobacteriota bacterium]